VPYFSDGTLSRLSRLHLVVATEGHTELAKFCLEHLKGWTIQKEMEMVLAAAFVGHFDIVSLLLDDTGHNFCSDCLTRHRQAMIGACIAGRCADLQQLAKEFDQKHPLLDDPVRTHMKAKHETVDSIISRSLVASAVYGFVTGSHSDPSTIAFLLQKLNYTVSDLLYSLELTLASIERRYDEADCILRFIDLFGRFVSSDGVEPIQYHSQAKRLLKLVAAFVARTSSSGSDNYCLIATIGWLTTLVEWVDIQDFDVSSLRYKKAQSIELFLGDLSQLKEKQRQNWTQFDGVKKGQSLEEVQKSVSSRSLSIDGYDRVGLQLVHLAGKVLVFRLIFYLFHQAHDLSDIFGVLPPSKLQTHSLI
jgi:hypothetical protein